MMNGIGQVKPVIFFDAAGTLIRLARPVGAVYAEAARALGAATEPSRMEEAFRQAWRQQPPRTPIDAAREDDDAPWWRNLAGQALRFGADLPPSFPEEKWFRSVYRHFARPEAWELYEDVPPALEALAPKARLAVLSNFDGRLRGILDGLGIGSAFEKAVLSSEVGADKPHPAIFEAALREMRARPADCWHVGDDPERDWAAAAAAGLHSFRLDRPRNSLADFAAEFIRRPRP